MMIFAPRKLILLRYFSTSRSNSPKLSLPMIEHNEPEEFSPTLS